MNSLTLSQQSFYYWLPPVTTMDTSPLDKSGTYAACEQMIQMPFMMMSLSNLDEMLERLERTGRLSPREHQSLVELARALWRVNS